MDTVIICQVVIVSFPVLSQFLASSLITIRCGELVLEGGLGLLAFFLLLGGRRMLLVVIRRPTILDSINNSISVDIFAMIVEIWLLIIFTASTSV